MSDDSNVRADAIDGDDPEPTMYYVNGPQTIERLSEDAERRARERGCECARPTFRHFPMAGGWKVYVEHTSAWCPLRPR
jgi:hypothetical protein